MNIEKNLLVDSIVGFESWAAIQCSSEVPEYAPVFSGHFPGFPIMPGVLMIELMAQASGFLYMLSSDFARMAFLVSVKQAKFNGFVAPGDHLLAKVRILHKAESYLVCEGTLEHTEVVARAQWMLRLMPFDNDELRQAVKRTVLDCYERH